MNKKFLNECDNCGYKGADGSWLVNGYEGLLYINERFKVAPEPGPNPMHFDLDTIDANILINKYGITAEKAEEIILNGEPSCPEFGSLNFFAVI